MLRSLVNIDPIVEFQRVAEMMDRAFGEQRQSTLASTGDAATFALPVDVYEKDETFFVRAAVPGVAPEQLDIQIQNNILTIRGETKQEWEDQNENTRIYRREYRYGTFSRSIRLPENLDLDKVDAEFNHGFVTISLPKKEEAKPKSLKVNVRSSAPVIEQPSEEQKAKDNKN
jgi:HSP20 family protein